jgi:formylglycine-generating enzyme required for sulfatase activity
MRAADVRAVGSMLYRLLTGIVPPSEALEESRRDGPRLEGGGGRFDDVVLGWEEARRDLGGLSPLVVALLERADVHADIDRLIDLVVPYYRRLIDDEYRQVDTALAAARATRDEVERWQRQERELESKLRWVKQWLREHAEEAGTVAAGVAAMERRESRLRTLELEMGMLLDRALPPSTRPASVAPPALEPVPTTPPRPDAPPAPATARTAPPASLAPSEAPADLAPESVVPGPAPSPDPAPAPALASTQDDRLPPRRSARLDQPSRHTRLERTRGEQRRWVSRAAAALGLLAVAGGLWRLFVGSDAGYESRPVPKLSATPASRGASSGPASAAQPGTAVVGLAPATEAASAPASAPTPPPGMLYVSPGLLSPGLAPAQVDAVLAQCRLDFGDRPQAKACVPELFKEEAPAAPVPMRGFFIDQYEVSQARYAVCVARGRCPVLRLHWDLPEQPATGVDLRAAEAFCRMNDARLPTVDEWLYAARGRDARAFPWGDAPVRERGEARANAGAFIGGKRAADREDGHPYAGPIAVFAARGASPFGVANLSGNVREWTSTEVTGSVMVMGGGFKNLGHELRLTRREFLRPTDFAPDLGFRCVRDLP